MLLGGGKRRLGIVTHGKSYLDVRQALDDLGIDEALAAEIGLSVYKVGMTWPLEREGIRQFAEGLEEILVVEEKRALVENQLKEQLYNWRADVRPRVIGKFDQDGEWLLPSTNELTPARIARVIARRIARYHSSESIEAAPEVPGRQGSGAAAQGSAHRSAFPTSAPAARTTPRPACPRAAAPWPASAATTWSNGWTGEPSTFTQMGGEGVPWTGQAPFSKTKHVFANLGDGTYFHSGILAIRACVAAKVNITFKILYNDAVAMTGGQAVDGPLDPAMITRQIYAEGLRRIVVVADDPDKYPIGTEWAPGVTIDHRDELDRVQRDLRDMEGVTAMTLRPDLRRRKTPPAQARHLPRSAEAGLHQRPGLRGLRRLLGAIELRIGRAGRDGVRPQTRHRPVELQQGLFLCEGLLSRPL